MEGEKGRAKDTPVCVGECDGSPRQKVPSCSRVGSSTKRGVAAMAAARRRSHCSADAWPAE